MTLFVRHSILTQGGQIDMVLSVSQSVCQHKMAEAMHFQRRLEVSSHSDVHEVATSATYVIS